MNEKQIQNMLNFDPLAYAETTTGKSYKDDKNTIGLGLGLHLGYSQLKREALEKIGDVHFGTPLQDYTKIISNIGFKQVLCLPFNCHNGEDELQIWWNSSGILLSFDTYFNKSKINGGKFYYNIKPKTDQFYKYTSSGHYTDEIWIGDHDCREALVFHIYQLEKSGEFLSKWIERPFLWLLHYMDTKSDYDYKKINEERINMLPDYVRKAISPKE